MVITEAFISSGMSIYGGWSEKQFTLIGVQWPPVRGWKKKVIGTQISDMDAQQFLALKDAHIFEATPLFEMLQNEKARPG